MKTIRAGRLVIVAFAALMLRAGFGADAVADTGDRERPEEFVVTAKSLQDLRLKIKLAEDDVYARFNDINSDDSHDIHCYDRVSTGSHVPKRLCLSNAWRTAEANIADSVVRGLQSAGVGQNGDGSPTATSAGYGSNPQKYRANQLRTEHLVTKELQRLANEDPALHEAMLRLGQAHQTLEAMTGSRKEWTLYRDVTTGDGELPFGAKRIVEVRVGEAAWQQPLVARTFTLSGVTGRIRDLRVQCAKSARKLEYQEDVDWTVPESWGDCTLTVHAKQGTTFALYEF